MIKNITRDAIKYIKIPSLNEYTREERSQRSFSHKNVDYIWERLQRANGKDVNDWEDIEDQESIETLLLQVQQKHFEQANNTVITNKKWRTQLSKASIRQKLQEGSYTFDDDDPMELRQILSTFQSNKKQNIDITLTYEDFTTFIKKSKEKKSSSPSGRHYGHYKTLLEEVPDILQDIFNILVIW